jgi:hypothetical protein
MLIVRRVDLSLALQAREHVDTMPLFGVLLAQTLLLATL